MPRWGYKGKNKADQEDWLVEVPEKEWKREGEAAQNGGSIRGLNRKDRKELIKRNQKQMKANEKRAARKVGA